MQLIHQFIKLNTNSYLSVLLGEDINIHVSIYKNLFFFYETNVLLNK